MNTVTHTIRKELEHNADEKIKQSSLSFFKEEIRSYGIKTAKVTEISKEHFKTVRDRPKAEIFNFCEEFWQSGFLEESFIACNWSYAVRKDFEAGDFIIFEKWIDLYVTNWASCDTLCNHTVGSFLEMYPGCISELKKWANSQNRWVRRASAVSLIIPARKGKFLADILEIAGILLLDKDDMVQKGYGWMLKAASHSHQKEIFDYIIEKKAIMPRTALRYAIEKMPPELKIKAMEK